MRGAFDGSSLVLAVVLLAGCPASLSAAPIPPPAVCGNGSIDEGENCDDGGTCLGGPDHGRRCPAEVGGSNCEAGFCRPAGGVGCAKNCTNEIGLFLPLGGLETPRSEGFGQGTVGMGSFPIAGAIFLTLGQPTGEAEIGRASCRERVYVLV